MTETNRKLILDSQLASLPRITPWLDELIAEHTIAEKTAFAIRLCLEESISNVIRHGYKNLPGHTITVSFHQPAPTRYVFIIEDAAPHFSPIAVSPLVSNTSESAPPNIETITPGGLGITLLRKFTAALAYEPLPTGNRLTLTFAG
jgi:serine/threonine-protein kinase RsbW